MKHLFLYLLTVCCFLACQSPDLKTNPSDYLTEQEASDFVYSIIRYAGKLSPKATHQTKFDSQFDEYYTDLANSHELWYYYPTDNGKDIYFLITRIAPSLHLKKVGIAGKVSKNDQGQIVFYEEKFRTWKMPVDELEAKSKMLFDFYINGKDLTPYYIEHSKGEEYIEFPNENVYYDTDQRLWISNLEDPLQDYYNLKEELLSEPQKIDSVR